MTALPLLLALHSCSDSFGMALLDPQPVSYTHLTLPTKA